MVDETIDVSAGLGFSERGRVAGYKVENGMSNWFVSHGGLLGLLMVFGKEDLVAIVKRDQGHKMLSVYICERWYRDEGEIE